METLLDICFALVLSGAGDYELDFPEFYILIEEESFDKQYSGLCHWNILNDAIERGINSSLPRMQPRQTFEPS